MPDPLYYSALSQSQQHAADHNLTEKTIAAMEAALAGRAAESEHWHASLVKTLFLQAEAEGAEAAVDRHGVFDDECFLGPTPEPNPCAS